MLRKLSHNIIFWYRSIYLFNLHIFDLFKPWSHGQGWKLPTEFKNPIADGSQWTEPTMDLPHSRDVCVDGVRIWRERLAEMPNSLAWGSSSYAGTRGALGRLCAKLYLLNQFSLPPVNHLCMPGLRHTGFITRSGRTEAGWWHRGLIMLTSPLDSGMNYTVAGTSSLHHREQIPLCALWSNCEPLCPDMLVYATCKQCDLEWSIWKVKRWVNAAARCAGMCDE